MKKPIFSKETYEFFVNEGVFNVIVGEINRQFGRKQAAKLFHIFVVEKYDPVQVINTISWKNSYKGEQWYSELESTYIMHMYFQHLLNNC